MKLKFAAFVVYQYVHLVTHNFLSNTFDANSFERLFCFWCLLGWYTISTEVDNKWAANCINIKSTFKWIWWELKCKQYWCLQEFRFCTVEVIERSHDQYSRSQQHLIFEFRRFTLRSSSNHKTKNENMFWSRDGNSKTSKMVCRKQPSNQTAGKVIFNVAKIVM